MKNLIEILSHPYLILNRVAEALYDQSSSAAIHQRLRSRVQGRHNFTEGEYKKLKRVLLQFCREIDRITQRLERAVHGQRKSPPKWKAILEHPWINQKKMLEAVGEESDLNYDKVNDMLRHKTKMNPDLPPRILKEYQDFAQWIREREKEARSEKKEYPFSRGRGGISHRPKDPK